MSDDLGRLGGIMEQVVKWEKERDDVKKILIENVESNKHLCEGQKRIFEVLGHIDLKINAHSERLTRVEDRASVAVEKIDKHEEGHWKQAALNVSILGLAMAIWKWVTGNNGH